MTKMTSLMRCRVPRRNAANPPRKTHPRHHQIPHYKMNLDTNQIPVNMRCSIRHLEALPPPLQHRRPAVLSPEAPVQEARPWKLIKSPVWCLFSHSANKSWLRPQPPTRALEHQLRWAAIPWGHRHHHLRRRPRVKT